MRAGLAERKLITWPDLFGHLAAHYEGGAKPPFDFAVVDEAQDVAIPELRFLAALGRAWPDALELRHGVFVLRESLVPYHRIQQIDVVRDPLERALGLSTLELRTAAATTDAKVPGIPADAAESLRRALLERAHVDDAV